MHEILENKAAKRCRYKYTNYVGNQNYFKLSPLSKNITFRELTRGIWDIWDVTVIAS